MHAQLQAPLPVPHAGLLLEQAAQRPLCGAGACAEFSERHGQGEVILDDACGTAQARVAWAMTSVWHVYERKTVGCTPLGVRSWN